MKFVEEVHKRGMRVILDGVFNHCGSFNKWMDAERLYENQYGYEKGAYVDKNSPYHDYFTFYNEVPHLGKIQAESFTLIKDVFDVFFRLPKRYKVQTASILTSQYRITPFLQKKNTYIRIPKVADFAMALDFFTIRSFVEPGFQQIAQNWKIAYEKKFKYPSYKKHKHTARKK